MALKSVLTNKVLTRVVRFMCFLLTLQLSAFLYLLLALAVLRPSYWFLTRLEQECDLAGLLSLRHFSAIKLY